MSERGFLAQLVQQLRPTEAPLQRRQASLFEPPQRRAESRVGAFGAGGDERDPRDERDEHDQGDADAATWRDGSNAVPSRRAGARDAAPAAHDDRPRHGDPTHRDGDALRRASADAVQPRAGSLHIDASLRTEAPPNAAPLASPAPLRAASPAAMTEVSSAPLPRPPAATRAAAAAGADAAPARQAPRWPDLAAAMQAARVAQPLLAAPAGRPHGPPSATDATPRPERPAAAAAASRAGQPQRLQRAPSALRSALEPTSAAHPPPVQVTIGRIEVRAVAAAPPPAPDRSRRAAPKLSLEQYLRERDAERGGRS